MCLSSLSRDFVTMFGCVGDRNFDIPSAFADVRSVPVTPSLCVLSLFAGQNQISDAGVIALASGLQRSQLTSLFLSEYLSQK